MNLNCTTNQTTIPNALHSTFPGSSTVTPPAMTSVTTKDLQSKIGSPTISAQVGSARIPTANKPNVQDSQFNLTDVALPLFQRKRRSVSKTPPL